MKKYILLQESTGQVNQHYIKAVITKLIFLGLIPMKY